MKEQTYFHIPTPCHENWDNMTAATKGRFCACCSKQVVDFSFMTDQQVLNYFKKSTGKVCGRFADDQLQRPMILASEQKKKSLWLAVMMPLLLLFGKVNAQKKKITQTLGTPAIIIKDTVPVLMGKIAYRSEPDTVKIKSTDELIIKGTIRDEETGEPVPFASVFIKNSKKGIAADGEGNFTLFVKDNLEIPILILASVGYETKEISLTNASNQIQIVINGSGKQITLKSEMTRLKAALMCDVVVTAGMVVSCKRPKPKDTLKTTVNKILKREAFKIYPNPANAGSNVKLEIKKAGTYSIQLLDNLSKLILVKDFTAITDQSLTEILIPVTASPGMYYINLIDENKKKQYTSKLIVQ